MEAHAKAESGGKSRPAIKGHIPVSTAHYSKYQSHNDIVNSTPKAEHLKGLEILAKSFGGEAVKEQYDKFDSFLQGLGF